jgi:DNA-binding helix-hairpin-helix protein with protein kinase domain
MNQKTRRNRQRRNTIRRRKNKRRQRKTRVKGGASFFSGSGYKPLNERADGNETSHQVAMYEAKQAKKIADLRIQAVEAQKIADEAQKIADEAQREEAQRQQAQRDSFTMFPNNPNNPPISANNFITKKQYIPLNMDKLIEERRRLNAERRRHAISAMEGF